MADITTQLNDIIQKTMGKSAGMGFGIKTTFKAWRELAKQYSYQELVDFTNMARDEVTKHRVAKTLTTNAGKLARDISSIFSGAKFEASKNLSESLGRPLFKTKQITPSYSVSHFPQYNIGATAFPLIAGTAGVGGAGLLGYGAGKVLEKTPLITDPSKTYGQFYQEAFRRMFEKRLRR